MGIIAFFGTKSIGEAYRKRPGRRELSVGPVTGYLDYMTIFFPLFPLEEQDEGKKDQGKQERFLEFRNGLLTPFQHKLRCKDLCACIRGRSDDASGGCDGPKGPPGGWG